MVKITKDREAVFVEQLKKYPDDTDANIVRRIFNSPELKAHFIGLTYSSISTALNGYIKSKNINRKKEEVVPLPKEKEKEGIELRGKSIVINWSNKSILTYLGEFGNILCSFDMHKAIQRSYVNMGDDETAAIVAMKFDLPHAKAVHRYAKLHGFTKSSLPQTDIEFETGLTVESAVNENLQSLKRETYRKTEKEKWKYTQKCADNWLNFHHNVLKPFENFIEGKIPKYKPITLKITKTKDGKFCAVVGISDWHFMKLCYNHKGEYVYNKAIARQLIMSHARELINEMRRFGVPDKIYVPVGGNDNLHIDNPEHNTTKKTSQVNATDGIWIIGMEEYVDITIDFIELFAQVAQVEAVCFAGNHDENTSALMGMFLSKMFRDDKRVNIVRSLHPRQYCVYGKSCFIFTHGHHLGSKRLQGEIHKIILGEAKNHGIDMNEIENFLLFSGHDHIGSFKDLNGNVQHFIMPSLSGTDDFWHLGQGYMGRAQESSVYIIDPIKGRKGICYSS